MPEEVRFFVRSALFGIGIAAVYWFLTYETAGSVLLLGFGVAALFAAVVLGLNARGRGGRSRFDPAGWLGLSDAGGEPFTRDPGRLPTRTLAPLQAGLGIAVAMLGFVFGAWLTVLGAVLVVLGGLAWAREAAAELARTESDDLEPKVLEADATGRQPSRKRRSVRPRC